MKSIKYLLISLLVLCAASEAYACWGPWYTPNAYYMYRVVSNQSELASAEKELYPGSDRNCREWQSLTSPDIPLEDIYEVVYKMELEEFEKIYDSKEANGNKFVEWITQKDRSILEFLILAKTNEYIRFKHNSRWYYPSMKIGARMTIEEIAERALSVNEPKLRDRYLLQGIRALFTLGRFQECVNLWNTEVVNLPEDNLMRQLIKPYIAGAEFRVNNSERAMTYFAELGDVKSLLFCAGRSDEQLTTVDALKLVCEYAPNSQYIEKTLQSFVRSVEPLGEYHWEDDNMDIYECNKLYELSLKMAKGSESDNPGMWYYTAAFLSDLKGDVDNASKLISLAEKSKKTDCVDESIKVFRIYIDAKTQPYNASYERKLFAQLKWLDSKIVDCMTDEVRRDVAEGYKLNNSVSFYYWNDMMRRILLAEVCPRMIKAGKHTRALQLANMADNRAFGIVDRYDIYDWISDSDGGKSEYKVSEVFTMSEFRYSENFNHYDYSNNFFEMVDSLGVNTAIRYVQNVRKPVSEFDKYLNARGYTASDYLNDIVGTQCLRNMRYKEAVEYLEVVSPAYKNHLNVRMEYDPFSIEKRKITKEFDFRYDFARRMYSLEQSIERISDPNRKALLLIEYIAGLRNSFDLCWGLTQYYRGTSYWGQVCEKRNWEEDEYTQAARDRVKELFELACDIVTDNEIAADINYLLCNFKTIAEKYPDTPKGKLVIGKCDNLYDYHADLFDVR